MVFTTATAITALSVPIKDLYEASKDRTKKSLAIFNNDQNIKALAKKLGSFEEIKTIWQLGKSVKISSFYYPSKVILDSGLIKSISSLKDLNRDNLVIQGTVGQGKSIFLRYLCIQELSPKSSGRIPVFVELRKLDSSFNIYSALTQTIKSLGFEISDELFAYYAKSGKLVLLLDGFDEIHDEIVLELITQLELWAQQYPDMQFIITSRLGGEIQKSNAFKVLNLAPLTADDYDPFMNRIGVAEEVRKSLLKAIQNSPVEIKEFLNTPLLLTLLVLVYQNEGQIPNELPDFFKLLFTTVFTRHDSTKPGFTRKHKSGLNERNLEKLYEAFCFAILRKGFNVNLKKDQFDIVFNDAIAFTDQKCEIEGFKHDIIKVACLLQEDGLFITFVHKSLLEYFSAAYIKNCTELQSNQIYAAILENWYSWVATLQFLTHIDKDRFVRFFQVPEIIKLLSFMDIPLEGHISDEKIDNAIEYIYKNSNVEFIKPNDSEFFTQAQFGPFYALRSFSVNSFYQHDPFLSNTLPSNHSYNISKDSNGLESIRLSWLEADAIKDLDSVKRYLKNYFIELQQKFYECNQYLATESNRANLLASFIHPLYK